MNTTPHTIPNRFYKYVTWSTGRIILETCRLRWSSPLLFNDAFDNQIDLQFISNSRKLQLSLLKRAWRIYSGKEQLPSEFRSISLAQLLQLAKTRPQLSRAAFDFHFKPIFGEAIAKLPQQLAEFNKQFRATVPQHKILCLCTNIRSALMWSYYADGHKGIALQFRSLDNSPWKEGRPVTYQKQLPIAFSAEEYSDMIFTNKHPSYLDVLRRFVFTKSNEWSHEHEWRLFAGSGRNSHAPFEDIPFNKLELEALIFGAKVSIEARSSLSHFVQSRFSHIRILRMAPIPNSYALEPIDETL